MQRVTFERLVLVCIVCSSHRPVLDWCLCTAGRTTGHRPAPATTLPAPGSAAPPHRHLNQPELWPTLTVVAGSMYSVLSHEAMIKPKEPPKMFARCACYLQCQGQGSVTGG